MRIDGSTRLDSVLDEDTGGILLRRLHPRIASYNDLVIFLMKSNMDIKFIGSGEGAKALLYYVTDYITKSSLPAHVGLAALSYAIQKTNDKDSGASGPAEGSRSRGALNTVVNRMMSHQELSHQQVMSYLVGGGDVYVSHKFRVLHWGAFDRVFKRLDEEDPLTLHDDEDPSRPDDDTFQLTMEAGTISSRNQIQDYVYRSVDLPFASLCLYEFVAVTETVSLHSDSRRRQVAVDDSTLRSVIPSRRGRQPLPRGRFSSSEHTQQETHTLRLREARHVPVILGDRIPRSDRGEDEKEDWARMMLILFVAWRQPTDVRRADETWCEAFARQQHQISEVHRGVIANMNVLSECHDVRDSLRLARRAETLALLREGVPSGDRACHTGLGEENVVDDYELFGSTDFDMYSDVADLQHGQGALDAAIGTASRELLDACYSRDLICGRGETGYHPGLVEVRAEDHETTLVQHSMLMRGLKKVRRPQYPNELNEDDMRPRKRRRHNEIVENVTVEELGSTSNAPTGAAPSASEQSAFDIQGIIDGVVKEFGLDTNEEQERVFRIIANHVKAGTDQLLMYVAGVGGTGKTHVIKAVLKLFQMLNR
ncbi:hypothetical protein FKP32DRAFT_1544620, partial [Trametes sanguinea]